CHNHNFIILVKKGGSDTPWITHHECITMTDQPCNGITTVPILGGAFQYFLNIKIFLNEGRYIPVGISFIFILPEKQLVFFVQKMSNFFKYGYGIGVGFWVLSEFNK